MPNCHQIIWWDADVEMFVGRYAEAPYILAQEPTQAECEQSLHEIFEIVAEHDREHNLPMPQPMALADARQVAINMYWDYVRGLAFEQVRR